jgi:hypothetical protein
MMKKCFLVILLTTFFAPIFAADDGNLAARIALWVALVAPQPDPFRDVRAAHADQQGLAHQQRRGRVQRYETFRRNQPCVMATKRRY